MNALPPSSAETPARPLPQFLIADDTPGKQFYLRALLRKSHFPAEIVVASTTGESEELIARMPNIVGAFVDYRMPETGGIPLVSLLRKHNPQAHIALVTASEGDQIEHDARQAGADTFVSTAYPETFVTEKILKLLEQWKETK